MNSGTFNESQAYWPYFLRWAYQTPFVVYQAVILRLFPFGQASLLVANALFMAGTNVLIYLLARHALPERGARFVAMLYLFYPAPYLLAPVLTNQHISLFFALLGLYAFVKGRTTKGFALAGGFLALGNALRPDAILLLAALIGMAVIKLILRAHRRDNSGVFHSDLRPILVTAGVYWLAGIVISGAVLLGGINPNGTKNTDPLWKFVLGLNAETDGRYVGEQLAQRIFGITDIDARHEEEALVIQAHLQKSVLGHLRFLYRKAKIMWGYPEAAHWAFGQMKERLVPVINKPVQRVLDSLVPADRFYFVVVAMLAIAGVLIQFRQRQVAAVPLLCGMMCGLFFMVYLFIETQERYRYFVMPFLFLLAALPTQRILRKIKRKALGTTPNPR